MARILKYLSLGLLSACAFSSLVTAQALPPLSVCRTEPKEPACSAVRGDRTEGWKLQSRAEVMAQHGIITTSQPLAAEAGLRVMMQGGNAIDAAVAASAVLNVVEPMNVGIAGDLFAIIYVAKENKSYVLNASGMAPTGATVEHFNSLGYKWNPNNWGPGSGMPSYGILAVTVPGTVWGWDAVEKRFGKKTFKESLEPAIDYAEHGFPISERIGNDWRLPNALPLRNCCTEQDPDSIKTWYIDGKRPAAGQIFRNPELAKTFRILQKNGADGFYKGEVARALVAKSTALGGSMTLDDLANYKGEWVEPATATYHGYTVLDVPPPSQDWAAEEILNILDACVAKWAPGETVASLGPTNPKYWHLMVEAKKLAYADLFAYNADPNFSKVPLDRLLSKSYAASLCGKVDPSRASPTGPVTVADNGLGDTIVLSAADAEGNMVSWVNSNYSGFGSGVTVPGYGFILHNRGALFTLNPKSPNAIMPHKRPFNTLSAGFVMRGTQPMMAFQLMGGDMQAQGHAQVLVNMLDFGANLQAATDMARFHHSQVANDLQMETQLYGLVGKDLAAMGHKVRAVDGGAMGGYQAILLTPGPDPAKPLVGGFYRAGSDHRKDGQAVGW